MTSPKDDHDRRQRVARQHLETNTLLGVDFVPIHSVVTASASTTEVKPVRAEVSSVSADEKQAALDAVHERHDAACPHCTEATAHTRTVFGEGDPNAGLMFVGEAPGAEEDKQGRPFVGRSGQKLEQIINAMGLAREQVYIANVLKSRPPNNRTPLQHEIDACSSYLHEQIRIIQPKVIVTLGGPAAKLLLQTTVGITKLRGTWATFTDDATDPPLTVDVMPTFHPAYLLRNYTQETRQMVWNDMQMAMERLGTSDS
ncbi:MAG: uracil-DNA glycosylase [Planctomycetota bacterium]